MTPRYMTPQTRGSSDVLPHAGASAAEAEQRSSEDGGRKDPETLAQVADGRREQIISAAVALFDEVGYNNATMREIAQAVGIAKATLYHHFGSKHDILFGIHETFIDLLIAKCLERNYLNGSPGLVLRSIMRDILDLMVTHHGHVRVFFEHYRDLPRDKQVALRVKRDCYEAIVREAVRRGVTAKEFREIDADIASRALFGMCNWAYQWYRSDGALGPREVADEFYSLLMNGLTRCPAGSGEAWVTAGG
jgi:TetR/AcrR family transcriptional regulator, cholesterol catabolism regulator